MEQHDQIRPTAPDVLIHLHIVKTGGTSLSSMVKHAFRSDEVFDSTANEQDASSALGIATYESCQRRLKEHDLTRIRYVTGHLPMGVHRVFDRPAKYLTLLRDPVDRVISLFYFLKQMNYPVHRNGRPVSFEEYVEDRDDIQLNDYQVRIISGAPELDAAAGAISEIVAAAPVEGRHLEEAKRNVEQHFLAVAQVEQLTDVALLVRRIYGWPLRRLQTEYKNATQGRPRRKDLSPRLLKIIEDCNSRDIELYEWAGKRFDEQRLLFEPELSRDRRIFGVVNRALTTVGEVLPWSVRKRLAEMLFYAK